MKSTALFPRTVLADSRIAALSQMDAGQLRLVLKVPGLQRSVRSCAAVRLRLLDRDGKSAIANRQSPIPT